MSDPAFPRRSPKGGAFTRRSHGAKIAEHVLGDEGMQRTQAVSCIVTLAIEASSTVRKPFESRRGATADALRTPYRGCLAALRAVSARDRLSAESPIEVAHPFAPPWRRWCVYGQGAPGNLAKTPLPSPGFHPSRRASRIRAAIREGWTGSPSVTPAEYATGPGRCTTLPRREASAMITARE